MGKVDEITQGNAFPQEVGSGVDLEKDHVASAGVELKRRLKSRHLQMIAIGGTIGTGLFIGSGSAVATSGPAGALIAYAFVGSIVFSVIASLGEMATYIPIPGAFTSYATRFVDPSLGFAMGWIYWFSWAITFALELTATGLIINFWNENLSVAIFIGVFWIFITALNLLPVNFYGEVEFWFSSIKVITVVGFMIFAICMNAGVGDQGYIGFRYWREPGAFSPYLLDVIGADRISLGKFLGFWSVLVQAGFSYQGTELVGIAAGETQNPRKAVPSAIKKTFYRILFLFVLTVFFIGIVIPSDNENLVSDKTDASASPFVIAARLAGVQTLPSIINAVLLTVVLSAANSNVYCGSRILVGLASEQCAPKILKWTTRGGVPIVAVMVTSAMGFLGFLNVSNNGGTVFGWFLNISSIAGFISWSCINGCHIRFMRVLASRNINREVLPYKAPLQPFLAYYGLFFNILIIFTQGFTAFIPWDTSNFFIAYVSLILFVVLFAGHKLWFKTKPVPLHEVDMDSGRIECDAEHWEDFETPRPQGFLPAVKHRLSRMFC
ncbi:hypothetical protein FQN49_004827 [Arthroderma sp. PD_2]|nr:hypothetical protein FQN49_004827 [Arthroderma sp. PD_2]